MKQLSYGIIFIINIQRSLQLQTSNKMEINDLRVQMYNKVADLNSLSHPELLSELCILDTKDYYRNINCFDVLDRNSHRYQLYVSKAPHKDILNEIIFLKQSPKLLFLKGDNETLVLQQKIEDRLQNYLIFHEQKYSPYIPESYARSLMMDLTESFEDYLKHKIVYNCISPKNIVKLNQKWQLSTVGLIFNVDCKVPEYTHPEIKDQQKSYVYSLGALLFKLIFGFPFYDPEKPLPKLPVVLSNYSPYFSYLESLQKNRHQKIYYFIERIISISPSCVKLLEDSLSGKLTLNQWKTHQYFTQPFKHKSDINQKNRELMMINYVNKKNLSMIMSAVEFKNKYPLQRLNPAPLPSPQDESHQQIMEDYRKHYLLRNISFSPGFQKKSTIIKKDQNVDFGQHLIGPYFNQDSFDPEDDFPCRQLIKLLEIDKDANSDFHRTEEASLKRQAQVKLYAYPYAIAFELLKIQSEQPIKIRRLIKSSISLLLELSNLFRADKLKPLHEVPMGSHKYHDFSEMKASYREHINQLYKYFLNEAMRKYNARKESSSIQDKLKKKEKGLQYYRLCLKLLEVSLIVRKNGADLDLGRIETSGRKQIEHDLEQLLKNYFPTKAEMH